MSKNVGGYLRGPWWRYANEENEKVRRCFVIAWGAIVMQPLDTVNGDKHTIRFIIKTGRGAGRSEKYLNCVAYGEDMVPVVMRAMEKGDIVMALGTWVENLQSKTKKHGIKTTYEMRVNFIIPMGLIAFLLDAYSTPTIKGAVNEYRNADADVWESDD